jgi:hypothetical protein
MAVFFTSNQLTLGNGQPPTRAKTFSENFTRGFIVYINMVNDGLMTRQFYYNFDEEIKNQDDFEKAVLKAAIDEFKYDYVNKPAHSREQFPYVFALNADVVNYGWTPCKVSYIFDDSHFQFLMPDETGDAFSLRQSVVFRRDKIVVDRNESAPTSKLQNYFRSNHSFFNLTGEQDDKVSFLRFDNFMQIDENGNGLPPRPRSIVEQEKIRWDFCMDIYVDVRQSRAGAFETLVQDQCGTNVVEQESVTSTSWLTIVFDPPQGNGGSGGPP